MTSDTLAQGAITLSGPLSRNKRTYFLASAENSYQDRASPVTSPIAPGNFVGHYRGWLGLLRIDHTIRSGHRVFFHRGRRQFFRYEPERHRGREHIA